MENQQVRLFSLYVTPLRIHFNKNSDVKSYFPVFQAVLMTLLNSFCKI